MNPIWNHFNKTLVSWAMNKYFKGRKTTKAAIFIESIAAKEPKLFAHWNKGIIGVFA